MVKDLTKHKSYKRKYIQYKGILTIDEGSQLVAVDSARGQKDGRESSKGGRAGVGKGHTQHCRRCGETRHNSRMCEKEVPDSSDSE